MTPIKRSFTVNKKGNAMKTILVMMFVHIISTSTMILAESPTLAESASEETEQTQQKPVIYETVLGSLVEWELNMNKNMPGTQIEFRGNQLYLVKGGALIAKNEAMSITNNQIRIVLGLSCNPPPKISVVQETKTENWLLTDGLVGVNHNEWVFLNGHEIKVIGGPFLIQGLPFSDTTVLITDGKPISKPYTPSDLITDGNSKPRPDEPSDQKPLTNDGQSTLNLMLIIIPTVTVVILGTVLVLKKK